MSLPNTSTEKPTGATQVLAELDTDDDACDDCGVSELVTYPAEWGGQWFTLCDNCYEAAVTEHGHPTNSMIAC